MLDLSLDYKIFIKNELDAAIQELDIIFNTENTELIGYPYFGTNFDQFLWQMTPSTHSLKNYVIEKINQSYFLSRMNPEVEVRAYKGEIRMIYDINVTLKSKDGEQIERKYQFR